MNRRNGTWVANICQKLEHMCMDVDHFVCKEPVLFVGNQMETVGKNMKNFFSGFVDTNSVVEIKENTVDSNINNPKEVASVPKELCHRPSSAGSCHSEQDTSEISQYLIGENGGFINNSSDNASQANLRSSTNILNIDYRSEEKGVIYDESLHSDVTANEYSDWGIDNILDLDLDIDNMIKGQSLMNLEEKKMLLNGLTDELERASGTSSIHQSSELESLIARNENQNENAKHIIDGGLSSERLYESLNLPSQPVTVDCNATETVNCLSITSDNHSSCESFTTLSFESNNEDRVSSSGSGLADDSMINIQDFKNDTLKSCVIVESGKLSAFPSTSRRKSYKKMIQDAFLSRKRLTKEYKQLVIWYGDIDKELFQPTEGSNEPPAQDLPDSEWEIL